jgi:hypothetical protein
MVHIARQRKLRIDDTPEEEEELDGATGDGEEEADTSDEPEYEKVEGETAQEAQDRIEAKYRARATSPLRAIRAFCVLCMGAQPREVAHCSAKDCVLFAFRDGKNPFQKRNRK